MSAAAISGTFSDFRTVKGRKVAQLVIEIPVEQADAALRALGGVPQPHDPKWVAIAQLDLKVASKADEPKERKAWADLPPSQQAAIRCADHGFQNFLKAENAEAAAQSVRDFCCVHSRKDLDTYHKARVMWFGLDRKYQEWAGMVAHG